MHVILVRHGIAVEREEWKGSDGGRPLTDRGAKRVAQVAAGLKRLEVQPTHVFSSPLVRAVETARILYTVLAVPNLVSEVDELLPDVAPSQCLNLLTDLPKDACVVYIGHEPHLGMLAGLLLTGRRVPAFRFKKAGACLIELPSPPKAGRGLLHWWMGPGQLRALGKKGVRIEAGQ